VRQLPAETATLPPAEAREWFRAGLVSSTDGWAAGWTQANLLAIPRDWAYDLLLYAQRNPGACPVLDVTEPGATTTVLAPAADLRTDLPAYRLFRDGELVAELTDVSAVWREDLVTFLIGCSLSFEAALAAAGVPLRHRQQGRQVPLYRTAVQSRPAGRLAGPVVASMRWIPAERVATAVEVTSAHRATHGPPMHIGSPAALGIADLARPDDGDPVQPAEHDVPVFWACGVTPLAAVRAARAPLVIAQKVGHMFLTDLPAATA
jgi:uncharacterized protein YcsI (UPF0317 family)